MEKALLETQIVDELLARIHRAGLFHTDGVSDVDIDTMREDLKLSVRLILEDNNVTA